MGATAGAASQAGTIESMRHDMAPKGNALPPIGGLFG